MNLQKFSQSGHTGLTLLNLIFYPSCLTKSFKQKRRRESFFLWLKLADLINFWQKEVKNSEKGFR